MDPHHTAHLGQTMQADQTRSAQSLLKMIDSLLKAYQNKKRNEHRIVVKVDGKVKFKAVVDKSGKLNINHNTLTPDEIKALQNYFKGLDNPVVNPKDFDVMVDDSTVLKTENGEVIERKEPQEALDFEGVTEEEVKQEEVKQEEVIEGAMIEPQVNESGEIDADYGLGEDITNDAIVATRDRDLILCHSALEAKRLEHNYCVKRGVEPGMQPLVERASILRTEINRDLPKFAGQLKTSIANGKYDPEKRSAPGLDHDMPLSPRKTATAGLRK